MVPFALWKQILDPTPVSLAEHIWIEATVLIIENVFESNKLIFAKTSRMLKENNFW